MYFVWLGLKTNKTASGSGQGLKNTEPAPSTNDSTLLLNNNKKEKMENLKSTKELLKMYYKGFAEKANWDSVLADDFQYIGGDMTKAEPVI